jgi:hypothetical protein
LFLCSLIIGGGLFFFSLRFLPASGPGRLEGYAALGLEAGVPDREAAGALEAVLGRPVLSESSQWVLLNSFEGLERVPLEDYGGRLEPFDPRRDGYAEKLSNFFVREGRRWFFIPLDRKLFGPLPVLNPAEQLKKKIAAVLDTLPGPAAGVSPLPFSLLMKSQGRSPGFRVLLFGLAWAAAFLFPRGSRGSREHREDRPRGNRRRFFSGFPEERRRLLLLAPLMLPLSLWGPPGFAFIALFLFLGSLLAEPLKEGWIRFLGGKPGRGKGPYRSRLLYSLPLVLPLVFVPWLGGIPPLWVSLNFLGLVLIYCSSLGIEIRRKFSPAQGGVSPYGPCRFTPLPILSPRFQGAPFLSAKKARPGLSPREGLAFLPGRGEAVLVLPFALASCLAVFFGVSAPSPEWPSLVREEDYRAHALFQAGFTRRSLQFQKTGEPAALEPGYFRYTLGEDGLVAGALPLSAEDPEIPPFPLADLSSYLAAWGSGEAAEFRGIKASILPALPLADLVSPLLIFLLVFPSLAGKNRGWKRVPACYDKRIAA